MATAINIMRTWWKPRNGISPGEVSLHSSLRHRHVVRTLHAHGELEIRHCVCLSAASLEWVLSPCALRGPGGCDGMHSGRDCMRRLRNVVDSIPRGRLVGSSCSFRSECIRCTATTMVRCLLLRRIERVRWIGGGSLECVCPSSLCCSPNTFGRDGNGEVGRVAGPREMAGPNNASPSNEPPASSPANTNHADSLTLGGNPSGKTGPVPALADLRYDEPSLFFHCCDVAARVRSHA
jgi:hypothetical protein